MKKSQTLDTLCNLEILEENKSSLRSGLKNTSEAEWMWIGLKLRAALSLLLFCGMEACLFCSQKRCFKQIWGFNIFLDVIIKSTRGTDFECSALFITSCVSETDSRLRSWSLKPGEIDDRRASASVKYDYHSISPGFCEHEELNKDTWKNKIQKQTCSMQKMKPVLDSLRCFALWHYFWTRLIFVSHFCYWDSHAWVLSDMQICHHLFIASTSN